MGRREFAKEERDTPGVLEKYRCVGEEETVKHTETEQPAGREKTRRIFYCCIQEERFQEGSHASC